MKAVFADTYYFLALANRRDKAHAKCVAFSNTSNRAVLTTDWVLMEVGDALCRGQDREVFSALLEHLAADLETTVLPASREMFERGVVLFQSRADKQWSLTDCTSFVVMGENDLADALTSDRHFEQAGFQALFAE